jgi:hypothetical protein
MGNIATSLSSIAAANCAQTYSFTFNGRDFPQNTALVEDIGLHIESGSGRQLLTKLTNAFNNDLTDCVEVFTPISAFSHLGNGQGLFRSGKAIPYFEKVSPAMIDAIMKGNYWLEWS